MKPNKINKFKRNVKEKGKKTNKNMSLFGHHTGVIKVVAKSNEYISFLSQTSKTNMLQLEQNVHFNHNLISKI